MKRRAVEIPSWVPAGGVDPDVIRAASSSPSGSWTYAQMAQWGVPIPPPSGWRQALVNAWKQAHATRCPVCNVLVNEDEGIVVTRGANPDGTLRVFYFCSNEHRWAWSNSLPPLGTQAHTAAPGADAGVAS